MRKHIIILLIVFVIPFNAYGTAQILDTLTIDSIVYQVYRFKLSKNMSEHFHKNLDNFDSCSANWDGFTATMILKENKLFVTELDIGCPCGQQDPNYQTPNPEKYFGISIPKTGLFASWFTGCLKHNFGDNISGIYSNARIFTFEKGILIDVKEIENDFYEEMKVIHEKVKATRQEFENANKGTPADN